MTVTSDNKSYNIFYVQLNIRVGYSWNSVKRNLAPDVDECVPSVGTFTRYPGDNNQYIWNLPRGVTSATLTLKANAEYPINITDMVIKSYRASFH